MNVRLYKLRNGARNIYVRLKHPWPIYKKVGGINAVVIRKDGRREDLGQVSKTYAKRWGVGAGSGDEATDE